jgi:hypothetical protein
MGWSEEEKKLIELVKSKKGRIGTARVPILLQIRYIGAGWLAL